MPEDRFLLIKAYNYNLWKDIDHVLSQLLVAEATGRIPVVYWSTHCLHNGFIHTNGFELYFEPVSRYTIFHLAKPEYTFYPPIWDSDNLLLEDHDKEKWAYRNIGDIIGSSANVVVSDVYFNINEVIPFVKKDNPAYGMTGEQACRYLFAKYIRVKPDIEAEIQGFYNSWLRDGHPLLAVHVRRADRDKYIDTRKQRYIRNNINVYSIKYRNISELKKRKIPPAFGKGRIIEPNLQYHGEIRKLVDKYGIGKIFLLTDSEEVLNEYKRFYGSRLQYTACKRLGGEDPDFRLENPVVNRRRGIEIIKDTYLAAKCDFFIGNDFSALSRAVTRLKDWPEGNAKLLFYKSKMRKYPVNVKIIVKKDRFGPIKKLIKKIAGSAADLLQKLKNLLFFGGG